jgi:hypothetical protein
MHSDTRLVLSNLLNMFEWMLVRDKKRLGDQDVKNHLKEIDLLRALMSDEEAGDDA